MKVFITLCFAFTLLVEITNAQTFQKSLGRVGSDSPLHMIEVVGGGYAVSGTSGDDVFLMRMDANGDTLWVKAYSNPKILAGSFVDQVSDGGFIIIGDSHLDLNGADQDIILIRTDGDGNELWSKTYAGSGKDYGTAIDATNDAIFLAGAVGISTYDTEGIVIKTGLDGVVLWERAIVGSGAENINSVIGTDDGGCIVMGTTNSNFKGANAIFVVRLNSNGDTEWSGVYNDGGNCYGFGMDVLEDGSGYIIAGATSGSGAANYDALLLKINDDYTVAWAKIYGGFDFDTAVKPVALGDEGFCALGQTFSFGIASDLFLIRTNSAGELTWAKAYGGDSYEFGEGLLALPDGFLFGGGEESFGTDRDVYLVKCDLEGNSGCNEQNCKPTTSDSNMDMMEADNVGLFTIVTGDQAHTALPGATWNSFCETISVHEEVASEPTIYPNPCNQFFTLQGTRSGGTLVLYDVMGKVVFESITRFGSMTVDVSNLPEGIYMLRYSDGDVVLNGRLVKE